jgi:hypothetical protein
MAQENSTISGQNVISLEMRQLTQNSENKEIPVLLSIGSKVNSERVQVTFSLPNGLEMKEEDSFFTEVKIGEPTIIERTVIPRSAGRQTVRATVQIFSAEVNYASSTEELFIVGSNFELTPSSETFNTLKSKVQVVDTLRTIAIIAFVLSAVSLGAGLFVRWLNAED